MTGPIISIDSSEIRPGKLDKLRAAVQSLVEFADANEPRPIAYNVYFNDTGTRMTVVQAHPDSASMEFHMTIADPAFPGFAELIQLSTMDIYGDPSAELLAQLHKKIQLLGNAAMVVHELRSGFTRFGVR